MSVIPDLFFDLGFSWNTFVLGDLWLLMCVEGCALRLPHTKGFQRTCRPAVNFPATDFPPSEVCDMRSMRYAINDSRVRYLINMNAEEADIRYFIKIKAEEANNKNELLGRYCIWVQRSPNVGQG
jgi:hypothetical protein